MKNAAYRLAAMACLVLAGTAGADTILIDFGPLSARHSVGAADGNGNWWNYVTGATDTIADLVEDDNTSSGISLSMSSGWSGVNGLGGAVDWGILASDVDAGVNGGIFGFHEVVADGAFFASGTTATISLGGLNDSLAYEIIFYGARSAVDPQRTTTLTVGVDADSLVTSGTGVGTGSGGPVNWNTSNTATLSDLASSGGTMTLSFTAPVTFGYVNAMQINVVPEPGTAILALLGGLAVAARRIRRA